MKSINYKNFGIIPDRMLGYSLIDRKGMWACSKRSIEQLKETADEIIKADTP